MKKTWCLILILTLALFLGSNTAFAVKGDHFKGTFEVTFIAVSTGTEVPGSEGKLNTNGQYKVEIEGIAAGIYQVCIVDNSMNMPYFLEDVIVDEDGELNANGNFLDTYGGVAYIHAPSFQVRSGSQGACDGTPMYESGVAFTTPSP